MEHLFDGCAQDLLRNCDKLKHRIRFYLLLFSFRLIINVLTNVLTEQFLQGNIPLWHLLDEETFFMSLQRASIIQVR